MNESILVLDVGSGTQDILLYQPNKNLENCPKFIVPSQTQIVAVKIREATAQKRDVFLHGYLMGGGANGAALKAHLASGFKAYATPQAAVTFNDNLVVVEEMGIILCNEAPETAVRIWLGDVDKPALKQALEAFGLEYPTQTAIAVQDHGYSVTESNRTLRFRLWKEFVMQGGDLKKLVFREEIPEVFTRMHSVRRIVPGAVLTDTGTAALLGIMADDNIKPYLHRGIIAVNIGNSHTLVAAIRNDRVFGIFEQHTSMLNTESLAQLIRRFRAAELTNAEIYEQGGHGSVLHPEMSSGWDFIAVTGPRRNMVKGLNWYEAAPHGDMMLTGSFGVLAGLGIT